MINFSELSFVALRSPFPWRCKRFALEIHPEDVSKRPETTQSSRKGTFESLFIYMNFFFISTFFKQPLREIPQTAVFSHHFAKRLRFGPFKAKALLPGRSFQAVPTPLVFMTWPLDISTPAPWMLEVGSKSTKQQQIAKKVQKKR